MRVQELYWLSQNVKHKRFNIVLFVPSSCSKLLSEYFGFTFTKHYHLFKLLGRESRKCYELFLGWLSGMKWEQAQLVPMWKYAGKRQAAQQLPEQVKLLHCPQHPDESHPNSDPEMDNDIATHSPMSEFSSSDSTAESNEAFRSFENLLPVTSSTHKAATMISSESVQVVGQKPLSTFGLGALKCKSSFVTLTLFAIILCAAVTFESFCTNGINPTNYQSLETRFSFSSKTSGVISIMFDVAYCVFAVPCKSACFGAFLQFVVAKCFYWCWFSQLLRNTVPLQAQMAGVWTLFSDCGCSDHGSPSVCIRQISREHRPATLHMWPRQKHQILSGQSVQSGKVCHLSRCEHSFYPSNLCLRLTYCCFVSVILSVGNFFFGAGTVAQNTLAVHYFEDNSPGSGGFFYGLMQACRAIGSMLGAALNAFFLTLPVDLQELPVDSSHVLWVGAWWIGLLVGGLGVFVFLPFLASFPPKFNTALPDASSNSATGNCSSLLEDGATLHQVNNRLLRFWLHSVALDK